MRRKEMLKPVQALSFFVLLSWEIGIRVGFPCICCRGKSLVTFLSAWRYKKYLWGMETGVKKKKTIIKKYHLSYHCGIFWLRFLCCLLNIFLYLCTLQGMGREMSVFVHAEFWVPGNLGDITRSFIFTPDAAYCYHLPGYFGDKWDYIYYFPLKMFCSHQVSEKPWAFCLF